MSKITFRRYTSLPFVLSILQEKRLPLLDPANWEDKDDSHYIELYKRKNNLKTVLAICFAESSETHHHWKIYSGNPSGICIEFGKDNLINKIKNEKGFISRKIRYKSLFDIYDFPPVIKDLPFIKRNAFRDEKEFRIIFTSLDEEIRVKYIAITQDDINRIIVNPWVHASVFDSIKTTIRGIDGCAKMMVTKSTVLENDQWKILGDEVVVTNRTKRIKPLPE